MKTWITSDLHFGHDRIRSLCPETRKFTDVEHMNVEMIRMWNEIVEADDLVYILGDFAFMQASDAVKVLNQLNGDKILIVGNHDKKLVKDAAFRNCFQDIHVYLDTVKYNKQPVIMFHYPISTWDRMHYGAIHLFGHVHGGVSGLEAYRARDVGMDATGKIVVLLDDICADAAKGTIKGHH
jgi:calcineurin-like phosphoesterase family protein